MTHRLFSMRHGSVEFIGMSIEEFSVAWPGVREGPNGEFLDAKGGSHFPEKSHSTGLG